MKIETISDLKALHEMLDEIIENKYNKRSSELDTMEEDLRKTVKSCLIEQLFAKDHLDKKLELDWDFEYLNLIIKVPEGYTNMSKAIDKSRMENSEERDKKSNELIDWLEIAMEELREGYTIRSPPKF